MSEIINDKCANCPRAKKLNKMINKSESSINYTDGLTEKFEQLALESIVETYGAATTDLLNAALATQDRGIIAMATIYTGPLTKVLLQYANGEKVTAKEIIEAAALGILDARQAGLEENPEQKAFFIELENIYNLYDVAEKAREDMTETRTLLEEYIALDKASLATLQDDCPGAKRNILLLGKYTCQSPNKYQY
jgi:hypothetical protein